MNWLMDNTLYNVVFWCIFQFSVCILNIISYYYMCVSFYELIYLLRQAKNWKHCTLCNTVLSVRIRNMC